MNAESPHRLRCEYLKNPIGIDIRKPRLSWELRDPRRGAQQSAFRIQVASSSAALHPGAPDVWDSGKVDSAESVHLVYGGPELQARLRYFWRVCAWDAQGEPSSWSEPAFWEMGILSREDWKAEFIGSSMVGGRNTTVPVPFFRKVFTLSKPVASARAYVTALGLYELHLNGEIIGDQVFAPGWTDYRRRVTYQVYDITDRLRTGPNAIGAILGDGWYSGYVGWLARQNYGERPLFLAQLHIDFTDGSSEMLCTDASWKTTTGPILESDFLMGESYDARLEMPGWDGPEFAETGWYPAQVVDAPETALVGTRMPGVRRIQELSPVEDPRQIKEWGGSRWIFDFGQNLVGRTRLKIRGERGTTITLRHGEMLDEHGNLYTQNLRRAKATDHYTLKGDAEEIYEPRFTFHGFRYAELTGLAESPTRDTLTAIVLHSDLEPSGEFECSEPLLNQLQHNIQWGQKGNFLEVPTDCPQRDERLGWTGDAQVFIRTAAFNMDVAPFFTKWQIDLADAQLPNGGIPRVVPQPGVDPEDGGPAWADAVMICPWTIYRHYGDRRLLEEHYPVFRRYVDFLVEQSPDGVRCHPDRGGWHCYGDWLSINADTPKDLIGTAFLARSAELMSEMARVLERTEDLERYRQIFEQARRAFIRRFTTGDGLLVSQTQTAYVLALYFNLLPAELREKAAAELVRNIRARGMHLSTGFVGSPYLQFALNETGHLDVAYQLLNQKTWPSWLYPVTRGATTIWERWDGWTDEKGFQDAGMNSFNHYAYGAIGAWLYAVVAGIDLDETETGYRRSIIRPRPGGGLTHARARLHTIYGPLESSWRLENQKLVLSVEVPPNTTATVYVPAKTEQAVTESGRRASEAPTVKFLEMREGAAVFQVGAGRYSFESNVGSE